MKRKRAFEFMALTLGALLVIGAFLLFQGRTKKYLQPITYQDFAEVEKKDPYYKGRWKYFRLVVDLVHRLKPESVLELGPYRLPLVKGGDTMDIVKVLDQLTYFHDATKIPWPMADKTYDLFIACEVWEHLGNSQQQAFREAMRVSRRAVFSFPYKWKYRKEVAYEEAMTHRDIDEAKIADWTLQRKPSAISFSADKRYVVYLFEFD